MSSALARACVVLTVLCAPLYGYRDDPPPVPPTLVKQECDNTPHPYTAPGGSATGKGVTPQRARTNAGENGMAIALLSAPSCELCPNGHECPFSQSCTWDNAQIPDPIQNPATGLWEATMTWDGCTITQTCHPCP